MTVCIYFLMNLQSSKKETFPIASLSAKSLHGWKIMAHMNFLKKPNNNREKLQNIISILFLDLFYYD